MTELDTPTVTLDWLAMNQSYLQGEMWRLRLLLQRRTLWLRRQWQNDPLPSYQGLVISEAQADRLLAGDDIQDEARFYQEDAEASAISRAVAEVAHNLDEQRQDMIEADVLPPLEVLVALFDLSPFERDVLLLCLAPTLDPTFAQLYAYVQDDVNFRYATPHLALALFAEEGTHDSFLPQAPLRRFCLLTLEPGPRPGTSPAACPLQLDPRIADFVQGTNRPDERVVEVLRPLPPAPLAPSHRDMVERLVRVLDAEEEPWPILNLTGPAGAGKRVVAQALCACLGLQVYGLDVRRLPAPGPTRQEFVHLLEREATLMQFALYLDADRLEPNDKAAAAAFDDAIEELGPFLVVGSRERWQTEQAALIAQVAKPDTGAQRALWEQALTGVNHSLDGQVDSLVQQFDFGPVDIVQAVVAALGKARLRAPDDGSVVTAGDLWQACREQTGLHLDELALRITPCYTWEDIVLPEDVFRQLREIAAQVAYRTLVYETWGFGAKLSRGRGISALFAGPSGTGKTMAAEILANHLKLDLYRIDLAGVVSKYIGETEKNLKKVFDAAEQSGAILFFDEADALFGKRTEVKDSHDRYANIEVNYLLQRMEDYRGLAILATNRRSALDRAFLRRLRFLVDFPFPDLESRRAIWQKVFPPQVELGEMDYDRLARLEIPGGNIRNIALNGAFLAADAGASIGMNHVMRATHREYVKIEKMVTEAEFGPYIDL